MNDLAGYAAEVHRELVGNILPFYSRHVVDHDHGGFYGRVDNDLTVHREASKGLVQHSRLLWSFAHAYRTLGDAAYLELANRARAFLLAHFADEEAGGFFWMVAADGRPLETHKVVYGQAFAIYGLAEHALATGDAGSLEHAIALNRLLQQAATEDGREGYVEARRRDWSPLPEFNIDDRPYPVARSMNTHLHLLEAVTTLCQALPPSIAPHEGNAGEEAALRRLLTIHLAHIVDGQSGHLRLHFDGAWRPLNDTLSYGHDIEASWLLVEAAEVVDDARISDEVAAVALRLAETTLREGLDERGAVLGEGGPGGPHPAPRTWWALAEGMVGFLNACQLSGDGRFLDASRRCWQYVQDTLIDREHGEWFYAVSKEGQPLPAYKVGLWKAPYHNARACMEVARRLRALGVTVVP